MGDGEKKEYRFVEGLPVLVWTLLAFLDSSPMEEVVITIPEGHDTRVRELLSHVPERFSSAGGSIRLVTGGESRQESVLRGLEGFERPIEYVLIHDGARPWVSSHLIREVLRDCIANDATIPIIPITDAVKRVGPDGNISEHLARTVTMGAQTPQAFSFPAILEAHRKASRDGRIYIDDSEIYSHYVAPVHTVRGDPDNMKITFPRDLEKEFSGKSR